MAERLIRGAGTGVVFAGLCVIAVWAASITIPTGGGVMAGSITLGGPPLVTGALAVVWGVVGGTLGALIPWPARFSVGSATPR